MKIALATDHAGFDALRGLQAFLVSEGYECENFGPETLDPADDYPDFIRPAVLAVASGDCDKAIILGSSGQGEAMVANRMQGIRAAVYYGPATTLGAIDAKGTHAQDQFEIIRLSRQHNDANVLSLAARFLNRDEIRQAAKLWLETPFSKAERHQRRINKIDEED